MTGWTLGLTPSVAVQPCVATPYYTQLGQSVYDMELTIVKAEDLPRGDVNLNPYIKIIIGNTVHYRTHTVHGCLNPTFDEVLWLRCVPLGAPFLVQVWDKDAHTHFQGGHDDLLATCQYNFLGQGYPGAAIQEVLPLVTNSNIQRGIVTIQVVWRPAAAPGRLLHFGPLRYCCTVSPHAVASTGDPIDKAWVPFSAWQLLLLNVPAELSSTSFRWNPTYLKAQQVFAEPARLACVRRLHAALWGDNGQGRRGVLAAPSDLLGLVNYGQAGGVIRSFSYVMMDGVMRFCDSCAGFLPANVSAHALLACGAEAVQFAGKFNILRGSSYDGMDGGMSHRLVLTNSCQTYCPNGKLLPVLAEVLRAQLPGLQVEVVEVGTTQHRALGSQVPGAYQRNVVAGFETLRKAAQQTTPLGPRAWVGKPHLVGLEETIQW